jgi:hypothetical protein
MLALVAHYWHQSLRTSSARLFVILLFFMGAFAKRGSLVAASGWLRNASAERSVSRL